MIDFCGHSKDQVIHFAVDTNQLKLVKDLFGKIVWKTHLHNVVRHHFLKNLTKVIFLDKTDAFKHKSIYLGNKEK